MITYSIIELVSKCLYCGNNPTPHKFTKVNDFFGTFLEKLDSKTHKSATRNKVEYFMKSLIIGIIETMNGKFPLRFVKEDLAMDQSRNKVLWLSAKERGIKMEELYFGGRKLNYYKANLPGKTIYFDGLPIPDELDTSSESWLNNKGILKERLVEEGVPVPKGRSFTTTDWSGLLEYFKDLEKPVIIKPANGSRGRHTTTFIYNEEQLREAYEIVKQIAYAFIVEEHLVGSVYRGTIVNGELVGVLRGDPPRIVGDGKHSIGELIDIKNASKHSLVKDVLKDEKMKQFLARNNYNFDSILDEGKTIDLTEKIGVGYGGYKAEEIHITHPKIKEYLVKAGKMVNYPIMGFDFIIEDITKSPDEQKWGIIECNSLPFIDLHFEPLEGPSINVGDYIWKMWLG